MTIIAAALRELMAAGVTGDALVTAIERIESATLPRRTKHAERQARYRERHKASQSVTSDDAHIYKNITTSEIKKKKKVSTALPQDWSPSDACFALMRERGWDDQKQKLEIHRFKDHAAMTGRLLADWHAGFRNWITSPYQHKGSFNGARTPTVQDAFDYALNRLSGDGIEGNPPMVDITPRRD